MPANPHQRSRFFTLRHCTPVALSPNVWLLSVFGVQISAICFVGDFHGSTLFPPAMRSKLPTSPWRTKNSFFRFLQDGALGCLYLPGSPD
ncbi:hypothetical protein CYLTODRAFT_37866 [Cylindrobasidium torrendii FP15055 ss-10]|uniref:Uncharacterized protein n=1 Tax=Cylindrobasidium torrendii FP15055 ss-10 TaxID=1314674 RepID=A0A0D7BPY1_9AGAR|nr:hypothetical protein CYLTODRAFT_37866 [Cylindrobasidium torrendii FP15055 ss-10]